MALDLDALLIESVGLKQKEKEAKQSANTKPKNKTKTGFTSWLNKEDKEAIRESHARISTNSEGWKEVSQVLMLSSQYCMTCGSTHTQTEGRFLLRFNAKFKVRNFERLLTTDNPTNLPRQVQLVRTQVDICVNCFQNFPHSWPANYLE